jgi:crotonobetainyl-CoA:carnitine CoA-transferase CaiB-like acyl-CoA transferase
LGEHGREILAELGVAEADIQRLIADRVVGDSAE